MLGRIDYLLALNISKSISRSIETTPNSFFPTLNLSFLSFFYYNTPLITVKLIDAFEKYCKYRSFSISNEFHIFEKSCR